MDLYSIVCVIDASVAVYLELSSGSLKWNVSFIKATHDCEVVFTSIFNLFYSLIERQGGKDKLCWPPLIEG